MQSSRLLQAGNKRTVGSINVALILLEVGNKRSFAFNLIIRGTATSWDSEKRSVSKI